MLTCMNQPVINIFSFSSGFFYCPDDGSDLHEIGAGAGD
jgi:hypothetical protein